MVGGSFNPVHVYLLVEQGVHILEFNNLQKLAADRVYEFAYFLTTNAIRGTVAGGRFVRRHALMPLWDGGLGYLYSRVFPPTDWACSPPWFRAIADAPSPSR
jgi:hypothetical protein